MSLKHRWQRPLCWWVLWKFVWKNASEVCLMKKQVFNLTKGTKVLESSGRTWWINISIKWGVTFADCWACEHRFGDPCSAVTNPLSNFMRVSIPNLDFKWCIQIQLFLYLNICWPCFHCGFINTFYSLICLFVVCIYVWKEFIHMHTSNCTRET